MSHPHTATPFDGTLYVGANYHPHDLSREEWVRDLDLMAAAGFRVLRAGHLAWDSYEPRDGEFAFAWFDDFMDLAADRGIGVILDVAVRPAPLWLHRKHPTIDIVNIHGTREHANTRYMEDVGDPAYLQYALRFADALSAHYADHSALLAFGIDNEPGSGPYSYSETVRARFIDWLRAKYTTPEGLSAAWAGQRWSRRISNFDEVDLPRSGFHDAPTERMIDFRTFVSDEITASHAAIIDQVSANAPTTLLTGNQWYFVEGDEGRYFDYAPIAHSGRIHRGGGGFYPHNSQSDRGTFYNALGVIPRIQFESSTPYWATEFTTETAVVGAVRKGAFASLLYGNQLVCGWTWQSHHAGEERFLQGQLDWDGVPNRKYDEYRQVASEFARIEKFGFPYLPRAEVALGFSFPSELASAAFPEPHERQLETTFGALVEQNIDARVVDLRFSALDYRVLILAGAAVIDAEMAERIRAFVADGGTVILTAYSCWFDEHGQITRATRPSGLDDVFGIRLGSFQEPHILNEATDGARVGDEVRIDFGDEVISVAAPRIDEVHLRGARAVATITGVDQPYPAVTVNEFGQGRAVYVALPARHALIDRVIADELAHLGIRPSIEVPRGVLARRTDSAHALLVNVSDEVQSIELPSPATGMLSERELGTRFELAPSEVEFVEFS
ncbi:beta-galactosidase [Microbacterium sp. GXF0217]